jgi:acetyl esterase/lipase
MRHQRLLRVILASAMVTWFATTASAEPVVVKDIEYAAGANGPLKLDLYKPATGANAPLLVWVHGGAWENGNKDAMPLGALVERGFAIASVDFSPASKAPFPAQIHEIKAAIRYLRSQAQRNGYDARRIGILGASSGGHLAAVVGTSNGNQELEGALGEHDAESSAVQAIVSYFGAANLTTILKQSTPFGLNVREPALKRLLGAAPSENEAIAKLASPVFQLDSADPPLFLLHGDQDPQMPINQSHELEGAYEKHGLTAELIVVHGAAHGGDAFFAPDNIDRVADFLTAHLVADR